MYILLFKSWSWRNYRWYDYLQARIKNTKKHRFSDTFCIGRSAFLFCFYCVYYRPEKNKQMSMTRKYHNHTLHTKTRPDIIMHFIKQRYQFHSERKLNAQKCVSVSVPFVPNVVVQHVSGFVACCAEAIHCKWKVQSYLWVMWHTILVSEYAITVILWGTVTGHNYSPYYNVAV